MNEEAASIFYNIKQEINNLEYSLDDEIESDDAKWIISDIHGLLDDLLPENRHKAVAFTNLEQSLMWAVKSISHK